MAFLEHMLHSIQNSRKHDKNGFVQNYNFPIWYKICGPIRALRWVLSKRGSSRYVTTFRKQSKSAFLYLHRRCVKYVFTYTPIPRNWRFWNWRFLELTRNFWEYWKAKFGEFSTFFGANPTTFWILSYKNTLKSKMFN